MTLKFSRSKSNKINLFIKRNFLYIVDDFYVSIQEDLIKPGQILTYFFDSRNYVHKGFVEFLILKGLSLGWNPIGGYPGVFYLKQLI